ncbi:hypothetical protein SUGI_0484710 [Cryptomeria japonica]|nr:hypothetical protein SUGI_0484710 [Cryptomeria japonica]
MSPSSPLYDNSLDPLRQFEDAMKRSEDRAASIFSIDDIFLHRTRNDNGQDGNYFSPLKASTEGDYVTTLSFGTPPQTFSRVFADTGSTLIWLKCSTNQSITVPESSHAPQHFFRSSKSETFQNLTCGNPICQQVQQDTGNQSCHNAAASSSCTFQYLYEDMSGAMGIMASDVLNLPKKVQNIQKKKKSANEVAFGCALETQGIEGNGGVGLDRGPYSLVSQLGPLIGYRFSYCLVPTTSNASSSILFGISANIYGNRVMHTPLLSPNKTRRNAYYIDVQRISLGGRGVPIPSESFQVRDGFGGTVLDTGTTFLLFATPVYRAIMVAIVLTVPYPQVFFPSILQNVPCYDISSSHGAEPELPNMEFYLRGGAKLDIPWQNLFFFIEENVVCMAVQESPPGITDLNIIGNQAQQNFHFSFDLERSRLRFTRKNCTEVQ